MINDMKYTLVKRRNPSNIGASVRYYASSYKTGHVGQEVIGRDIAGRSSLTRGDVYNVVTNLIDEIPNYLLDGKSVTLEGFGTFRLSVSSSGVDSIEEFKPSMIKGVKVVFTPSVLFKSRLKEITLEKKK